MVKCGVILEKRILEQFMNYNLPFSIVLYCMHEYGIFANVLIQSTVLN